ncbi:protoporphyrinogen oxidase [Glycomyces sp. A-F 0318]|uniref:protoporphyrinogen oxidase n=1 Tax=Glycomyces amatae TaxID=2881355 RepID=UPI001E4A6142|nr:protoporphyrinogen oxidase [Glycomyces amatae]MCD0443856.1 protoporphyrinogen oxidase [Glycomyces amatae]
MSPMTPARVTGTPGRTRVLVVGGGITGLAAAHRLRERLGPDAEIIVAEQSMRLGGKIRTVDFAGRPVETGAESLLAARPEAIGLARAVGLGDAIVHPANLKPALSIGGRLVDFPAGHMMGIPGDPADVAALADAKERPDNGLPILEPGADMSVGALVRERLGDEVLDRLVAPMLAGVYAGDVDRLSVRAVMPQLAAALERHARLTEAVAEIKRPTPVAPPAGVASDASPQTGAASPHLNPTPAASDPAPRDGAASPRLQGAKPVFATIDGGLNRLVTATSAAARAEIRLGMTVRELRQTPYGWEAIAGPVPDPIKITADALVIAVPASPAAELLRAVEPQAAAALSGVAYASVALAAFAFDRLELPERSGFLTPASDGKTVKAATFASQKWPHLGRRRQIVRVSMGRLGEEALLQYDDATLAKTALRELGEHLGQRLPDPVEQRIDRWGGALPQYTPGHLTRVAAAREALGDHRRIAIAGAAVDGVGIAACVASGRSAAEAIADQILADSR